MSQPGRVYLVAAIVAALASLAFGAAKIVRLWLRRPKPKR